MFCNCGFVGKLIDIFDDLFDFSNVIDWIYFPFFNYIFNLVDSYFPNPQNKY